MAEDRFQVDVSAGVSASQNPFLQRGDNTSAAAAFIQLDPQFRTSDEVSKVALEATLRFNRYFRLYSNDVSAQAGLDVERRLSPATLLRARASVQTARTSALDFILSPGVGQTGATGPIALPDVTFGGTRSRTTVLEASVGLDHKWSARERFSADLTATTARFSQAGLISQEGLSDYRFVTANFDYRRALSEQTTAFFALRLGYTDFLRSTLGDGTIIAPTVGIATKFGPRISLEAGLGASLTRVNDLGGRQDSRIVPAAQLRLCQRGKVGKSCFNVSRGSQPTARSGLTTVTAANFSYDLPVNRRDHFVASASYIRTDRPATLRTGQISHLLTGSATYDRTFNRRSAAYLTTSYTRLFDIGNSPRADIAVRIGLRYRFGGEG